MRAKSKRGRPRPLCDSKQAHPVTRVVVRPDHYYPGSPLVSFMPEPAKRVNRWNICGNCGGLKHTDSWQCGACRNEGKQRLPMVVIPPGNVW